MKKKSLKETNPYLKDPKKYESALIKNVVTSSAVEGIRPSKEDMARLKELACINRKKFLAIRKKYHPHHIPTP